MFNVKHHGVCYAIRQKMYDLPEPTQSIILGPDDKLAISFDRRLTAQEGQAIKAALQEWWPGLEIAIFDGGARLSVLSSDKNG